MLAFEPGKGREALETINRAIALDGPKPDLLDTRAVVQLSLGQSEPAVRDLQDAIAVNPAGTHYFHLAQAYLQSSDRKSAADALEKGKAAGLTAESLHPLEREAYRQLVGELAPK